MAWRGGNGRRTTTEEEGKCLISPPSSPLQMQRLLLSFSAQVGKKLFTHIACYT